MMANGVHKIKFTYWDIKSMTDLSHFNPMFHFYTPWKRHKKPKIFWRFQRVQKEKYSNIRFYNNVLICYKIESKSEVKQNGSKFKIEKNVKGCCSDHNDSSSVVSVNSKKDYPTNFWSEHAALALKAAPSCNSCLQKPTFYQNVCCVKSKITLQLAFLRFVPMYHKCISERFIFLKML